MHTTTDHLTRKDDRLLRFLDRIKRGDLVLVVWRYRTRRDLPFRSSEQSRVHRSFVRRQAMEWIPIARAVRSSRSWAVNRPRHHFSLTITKGIVMSPRQIRNGSRAGTEIRFSRDSNSQTSTSPIALTNATGGTTGLKATGPAPAAIAAFTSAVLGLSCQIRTVRYPSGWPISEFS